MIDRATKLRWRRRLRHSRAAVGDIGVQAEERLEKHLFKRLTRVYSVRRFMTSWLLLVGLLLTGLVLQTRALSGYFQSLQPVPGGSYSEGIIGSFTNANPLYASGSVDRSVSRLVFSGLLTYDQDNNLVGDLATAWKADRSELVYTVSLRDDVKWHDGRPFTAEDVAFTYRTIQNPDAKSPLRTSWTGIKIETPGDYTVVFRLPNTLSAFPYALTNGIVPQHLLEDVPVSQLRSIRFNTLGPVGTGAFKWDTVQVVGNDAATRQEIIGLMANEAYYKGAPKLQRFVIRTFRDEARLLESFQEREVDAIAGLNTLPDTIKAIKGIEDYNVPLTGEVLVFFKNSQGVLKSQAVRQALVRAADTEAIIRNLDHTVIPANSPLLKQHVGYDRKIVQYSKNLREARRLLNAAGWKVGADGVRAKGGQRLSFKLRLQSDAEYLDVSRQLLEQWRAVGFDVEGVASDENFEQDVALHDYDALLYGISLGNDPDVFAYWHSSQASPTSASRLNLSEYKSNTADRALEAGRTRSDPKVRAAKYELFLKAWRKEAPALALYQPRFLYVTHGSLHGFDASTLNSATDRYNEVETWMARQAKAIIP